MSTPPPPSPFDSRARACDGPTLLYVPLLLSLRLSMFLDDQLSVPGSELLPWDCLVPSRREAVLLVVSTPGDVEALKVR